MDKKEYIEREAARLAYEKSLANDKHRIEGASAIHRQEHRHMLHILEKLPAADVVEVRHGEWRFKEYGEDTYTNLTRVYECSLCGRTIECLNEADEPYCHCGAKMDGERKEQNGV